MKPTLSTPTIALLALFAAGETLAKATSDASELMEMLKIGTSAKVGAALNSFDAFGDTRSEKQSPSSVRNNLLEEELASEIENSLVKPWQESWRKRDFASFQNFLTTDFRMKGWTASAPTKRSSSYFEHRSWQTAGNESSGFLSSYLSAFSEIEDCSLDYVATDALPKDVAQAKTAQLSVRFDLRGQTKGSRLQNDRGMFLVEVRKDGKDWKIARIETKFGESVSASKKFFSDATAKWKLDNAPVQARGEAIRRGGYALSLADYNNDGALDLYFGAEGASILYKGNTDGSFQRDKSFDFADEKSVKTAIFSDLDNDGWQDLITVKFVPREQQMVTVFRNARGKFVKERRNFALNPPDYAMPAAVGDFNKDGSLDLYVGYPGFRDFTHMEGKARSQDFPHGVYLNDGKGGLQEAKHNAFLENQNRLANRGIMFPHSAIAVDYNNDGKQDLIVMDDRGGISPVFENLGGGKFKEVAGQIGISNRGYGMGTAVGDFDRDGLQDVVMTNVDLAPAIRQVHAMKRSQQPNFGSPNVARGLVVYRNQGNGKFEPVRGIGLDWVGLGSGGAEFVDIDNDGWLDLYVTNGLWSGTLRNEDLSSHFVRAMEAKLAFDRPSLDFSRSNFMRILTDVKKGIHNPALNGSLSMAGYQRNRLFRNNGNGTFTEVGYLAGVDTLADGYVVAKADLNRDGKMDLVLRNADPGTLAYTFPSVQAFLNEVPVESKSVVVRLEGAKSNRDGIGAKVIATVAGKKISQELVANNGAAQSDRALHFGLGSARTMDSLEVLWPSGSRSVLRNLQPGSVLVKESEIRLGQTRP